MKTFALPDLGEGLDEAEIVAWHVNVGDRVVADQPLLSVETAKAVVEVPSPWAGRIRRLAGAPGDTIKVGAIIVEFEDAEGAEDAGTVVGKLPGEVASPPPKPAPERLKASPSVRALARERGIDLLTIRGTGPDGTITRADIANAGDEERRAEGYLAVRGVRRAMALNMARSALEVPCSTVTEEAIISGWRAGEDISLRLVRAIVGACRVEPALNAWFDNKRMALKRHARVDLGIAVNSDEGLFVPVLRDAGRLDPGAIRAALDKMKTDVKSRHVTPEALRGPTISLSNFGMMGGILAALAIVPPQVSILGAGRIMETVRPVGGKLTIVTVLPLSLSFDHRVVTGAEAVRFLMEVVRDLEGAGGETSKAAGQASLTGAPAARAIVDEEKP